MVIVPRPAEEGKRAITMALTREYELAAVRCTIKRYYLTGPERAQKFLKDAIRYWKNHNMPADAEGVRGAVREELARRDAIERDE
jgi:hypothetical protein